MEQVKPRGNRRATIRYRCAPATVGKILSADDQEYQRVWVLDLSMQGVGLQVARPLEPGHFLVVLMKTNDGKRLYELPAQVIRCDPLLFGEFQIGCELAITLTMEDLDQLL